MTIPSVTTRTGSQQPVIARWPSPWAYAALANEAVLIKLSGCWKSEEAVRRCRRTSGRVTMSIFETKTNLANSPQAGGNDHLQTSGFSNECSVQETCPRRSGAAECDGGGIASEL